MRVSGVGFGVGCIAGVMLFLLGCSPSGRSQGKTSVREPVREIGAQLSATDMIGVNFSSTASSR